MILYELMLIVIMLFKTREVTLYPVILAIISAIFLTNTILLYLLFLFARFEIWIMFL